MSIEGRGNRLEEARVLGQAGGEKTGIVSIGRVRGFPDGTLDFLPR